MNLVVTGLTKQFRGSATAVLDRVTFTVDAGSFTCLLGPSGAGKTTLLHVIAGLVDPDHGSIVLGDVPMDQLAAHRRPITLLMQQPQLFAHLDVMDNIAFGLRVRGVGRRERRGRAGEMIERVGIGHLAHRHVRHLSGGEQQRVALARALILEPGLLLADEPFASVDADTRLALQNLLRELQADLGTTILLVTHDDADARRLSDRLLRLRDRRVTDETGAAAGSTAPPGHRPCAPVRRA